MIARTPTKVRATLLAAAPDEEFLRLVEDELRADAK
jgi:hypothetical protein